MPRADAGVDARVVVVRGVAVMAVLLVVLGLAASRLPGGEDGTAAYVSPYDWEGLVLSGDRLALYEGDELLSQTGVDVSDHQGTIDWQAVADDGIDFAFVRLGNRGYTQGELYADDLAAENLDGAADAGLSVGAYFFSQATTVEEAVEEARFALEVLDGRELDLPIAFDHETVASDSARANDVSGDDLAAIANAFCEVVEEAGYTAVVYGNASDLARFDGTEALSKRAVWWAEYTTDAPSAQLDFALWQYSAEGQVDGIEGDVDLNLLLVDAL